MIEQYITGFSLLSADKQQAFRQSPQGIELDAFLLQTSKQRYRHMNSMFSYNARLDAENRARQSIREYIAARLNHPTYQQLKRDIIAARIANCFYGFVLLNQDDQDYLINRPYSQQLYQQPWRRGENAWLKTFFGRYGEPYKLEHWDRSFEQATPIFPEDYTIYLSTIPRPTCWIDGMDNALDLPTDLDVINLEEKLQTPEFRYAVMTHVAAAGYIRHEFMTVDIIPGITVTVEPHNLVHWDHSFEHAIPIDPQEHTIYLSTIPRPTFWIAGMDNAVDLPATLDVTHLEENLQTPEFRHAVITYMAVAGHVRWEPIVPNIPPGITVTIEPHTLVHWNQSFEQAKPIDPEAHTIYLSTIPRPTFWIAGMDDALDLPASLNVTHLKANLQTPEFKHALMTYMAAAGHIQHREIPRDTVMIERILSVYMAFFGFLFKTTPSPAALDLQASKLKCVPSADNNITRKRENLQKKIADSWDIKTDAFTQDPEKPSRYPFYDSLTEGINKLKQQKEFQFIDETMPEYIDDMANAHLFFRFWGLNSEHHVVATEGISPTINVADIYNYHKWRLSIKQLLIVFEALRIPLTPFFAEYHEISKYEKDFLRICLRAFLPFLVMSLCLTLGYSLLLPFAVHQFLEILLFIPTLYLSITAAGVSVDQTKKFYQASMDWWYGDLYNSPGYQANAYIKSAFGDDDELSQQVAAFYAAAFRECRKTEQKYVAYPGALSIAQQQHRQANQQLHEELKAEWYALHDEQTISADSIPQTVLARLEKQHKHLKADIATYSDHYLKCSAASKYSFFDHQSKEPRLFDSVEEERDNQRRPLGDKFAQVAQAELRAEALQRKINHFMANKSRLQPEWLRAAELC